MTETYSFFVAQREIAYGSGIQRILIDTETNQVVEVRNEGKTGGELIGYGADDLIGQKYSNLRGYKFRKLKMKKEQHPLDFFSEEV